MSKRKRVQEQLSPLKIRKLNKKDFFLDLFKVSKIPTNSDFYPRIQNYSCYVKLLNAPKQNWLIYNIPGTLENTKKKKTVTLIIIDKKLIFKSNILKITEHNKIRDFIKFISEISDNFDTSLITEKNEFISVLKLNKLVISKKENLKKCFDFLDELFEERKKLKNKKNGRKKKTERKKTLILKLNTLHIVGEKSIEKIYKYIRVYCNIINEKRQRMKIEHGANLTATNIVYQIRIPRIFTLDLISIYKNLPIDNGVSYTHKYEPDKFPSLIIKIFELNGHKKTTLAIYSTGFINITGFKDKEKIKSVYPHIIKFLYTILPKDNQEKFLNIFKNINDFNEESKETFEGIDKLEKLEEEFTKEKDQLENINQKKIFGKTGLMFRKSDLNERKLKFTERYKKQYEINFNNLKNIVKSPSSYYNETLNLYNFNEWHPDALDNWFLYTDEF